MRRNILIPEPGVNEILRSRFPYRILERGPITFFGPFSDDEVDQARIDAGRRPLRRRKDAVVYRNGNYHALVDVEGASDEELLEVFKTFLEETSLSSEAKK